MGGYQKRIQEVTGCTDAEAQEVEDIMRHNIFHSTLDWQTPEQFDEGAQLAFKVLKEMCR